MEFYPSNFQIENKNNEREHFLKIYDIIATFKIKFIPIVYFFTVCLFIVAFDKCILEVKIIIPFFMFAINLTRVVCAF